MEEQTYTTTLKRKGKQVYIPESLIKIADIQIGDYLEVVIRKITPPSPNRTKNWREAMKMKEDWENRRWENGKKIYRI